MAINVKEYIEDNDKLELYYIPFGRKVEIIDIILDNVINRDTKPASIDTALLKNISIQMFIQNITNMNLSEENNDGENGYDILCRTGELSHLLDLISPEFNRLQEMLNDKLSDFYRYEYSPSKAINTIKEEIYSTLTAGADYIEKAIKNIDVEKIVQMMPKAGGLS